MTTAIKTPITNKRIMTVGLMVVIIALIWTILTLGMPLEIHELSGPSMYPTFQTGESALINTSPLQKYRLNYNNFVVVKTVEGGDHLMFKRVVGLPGDCLEFEKGTLKRNGVIIDEPYLNEQGWEVEEPFKVVLNENEIYVLGDNRNHSIDSRNLGPINLETQYHGVFLKEVTPKESN